MKFIQPPEKGSWVTAREDIAAGKSQEKLRVDLKQRVLSVQSWFFDLDDNHADSPAKIIVRSAIGTSYCNPQYLKWCVTAGLSLLHQGKAAESACWQNYVQQFLRDPEAQEKARELFSPQKVQSSLYPGVESFCSMVSSADTSYVTRNITPVAEAYAKCLGINGCFAQANHKEKVVEQYVQGHPELQRYGVDGDSQEDGAMIDVLHFYKKQVVGLYSMESPTQNMDLRFDYATSKNRSGLVRILMNS